MGSKISYCVTCKGRLYHLKETLPRNIAAEANDPDVEFVLLNYQSEDGMAEWVRETFPEELASGRLVHGYHAPAPHFRMAHAKNISHRVASGDILCNLDADNILVPGYAAWLRTQFAKSRDITVSTRHVVLHGWLVERILKRLLGMPRPQVGSSGRIAVTRDNFYRLGGYDETFSAWGSDDIDFQLRGRDAGMKPVLVPKAMWGSVIAHGNEERVTNLSDKDKGHSAKRLGENIFSSGVLWARKLLKRHETYPNVTGNIGCGDVWINYAPEPRHFGPLTRSN